MLNNNNVPLRRIPTGIALPQPRPMRSFNNPFASAKSFARASCNSST
jgi:hypothetical protein